jgi:dihydroorotase
LIDPHCHLRDWDEWLKETLLHAFEIAYRAGLDAVFEMGNTNPALISEDTVKRRIDEADAALAHLNIKLFHGIWVCTTTDPWQQEEAVRIQDKYFPRVVGIKTFAGNSTQNMGIIEEEEQRALHRNLAQLGYKGVHAIHCEKESLMHPELFDPKRPFTHTLARPWQAEYYSVSNQIQFAIEANFAGTIDICHVSYPGTFSLIERIRSHVPYRLVAEVTPHHCVLYDTLMNQPNGSNLKMNPPLRAQQEQMRMLELLLDGRFAWIGTDHAPHTLEEKQSDKPPSGIPGFPFYPRFVQYLCDQGMPAQLLDKLTHDNIVATFNLPPDLIPNTRRALTVSGQECAALAREYPYDAFTSVRLS